MFFGDYLTLYNKYQGKDSDKTIYKRTYLFGVDYQGAKNVTVTEKGLLSADSVKILVPFSVIARGKMYIDPFAYNKLSEIEKEHYYTFRTGDIVVKGIIGFDITSDKGCILKDLQNKFDDVSIIKSVIKCDFGSMKMRHFELEAE
ncbi:hypothetical protein Q3304_18650 [Clostridioides sp. GD02377]|uniref:hypothetical protein n=1 Tax=unclassified Clostridioides TaxID=2635829 RepID=UPI0038A06C66